MASSWQLLDPEEENQLHKSRLFSIEEKPFKRVTKRIATLQTLVSARARQAPTPPPEGDGGYKPNGPPSQCPKKSNTWDVDTDALPAIPSPAKKYMTEGAGTHKGLNGPGSQNAGTESSGTATAGSGKVTATASGKGAASTGGKKTGAASAVQIPRMETAPFVASLVVLISTLLGAALL